MDTPMCSMFANCCAVALCSMIAEHVEKHLSSVQNPGIIPFYWLVYGDSPIGLLLQRSVHPSAVCSICSYQFQYTFTCSCFFLSEPRPVLQRPKGLRPSSFGISGEVVEQVRTGGHNHNPTAGYEPNPCDSGLRCFNVEELQQRNWSRDKKK